MISTWNGLKWDSDTEVFCLLRTARNLHIGGAHLALHRDGYAFTHESCEGAFNWSWSATIGVLDASEALRSQRALHDRRYAALELAVHPTSGASMVISFGDLTVKTGFLRNHPRPRPQSLESLGTLHQFSGGPWRNHSDQ
ncbi:MAG: hypothetical protein ACJAYU_004980 [Bradymonadia bacterium]|jgi:hypothetical protein